MADRTATSTFDTFLPQLNKKAMLIKTPAATATGDTLDLSAHFTNVEMAIAFADDGTGGIMTIVISSNTTLTFGTITTGIHHVLAIGTT